MTEINALVFNTDGTFGVQVIDKNEVDQYQRIVGGWIEAIQGDGWSAYLNEEGKLKKLPPNPNAETFVRNHGWHGAPWDQLVGNVIIVGPPDEEGYDTSVNLELVAWAEKRLS